MESLFDKKEGYADGIGNSFNMGRPNYKKFREIALAQQDMFDDMGEDIPCFCGD